MEQLNNILGIYCATNGFKIALSCNQKVQEHTSTEQTSDNLVPKIMEMLSKAKIQAKDLNTLCVCVGPGSFTGDRIAVSFAKGLKVALPNLKVVPFTSFDFISHNTNATTALIPAFSNLVYVQHNGQQSCIPFSDAFNGGRVVAFADTFQKWNKGTYVQPNTNFAQFIEHISTNAGVPLPDIHPIYLRASQAEIEREKKLNSNK